jgi:formylglycine-generating enzyme required for sulfatase activity
VNPLTTEKEQKALTIRESYDLTVPKSALIERGLALAESLGKKEFICPILNAKFVLIPAGTFMMGSPEDETGCNDDETLHQVTISKPFYLQTTPVTQRQWKKVMGSNPSYFKNCGDDCPVEQVSWNDIQEFISKLNFQSDKKYRLPTEAEWEYAARSGGKKEKWAGTSDESSLGDYAWYVDNCCNKRHPVSQKVQYDFFFGNTLPNVVLQHVRQHPPSGSEEAQWTRFIRHVRQRLGVVFRLVW